MYKACVIGCGEIGFQVVKELVNRFGPDNVAGVDITQEACEDLESIGVKYYTPSEMPDAEVYIISLWTMESIQKTAKILENKNPKLIFIESTIDPSKIFDIELAFDTHWQKLVYFPHRYNPNDFDHHIFNQTRLLSSPCAPTTLEAVNWLVDNELMEKGDIFVTSTAVAILGKVVENAYRAMEIIMAQEIKKACDKMGVDFENLKNACNTKWNINIKDARDGVKGKCLPKDLNLFNKYFSENMLFRMGEMLNNEYVKSFDKK